MRHFYSFFLGALLLALGCRAREVQTASGTVSTEMETSLPGATVFVKGSHSGSSTNEEGQFQLKADFSKPVVLAVAFGGFRHESTFATGTVPVAQAVDAQVGYTLKALHTTLQVGATNLFDTANLQVYGAPQIGRIGYFGLLFDLR